jgi:hypothetical protein
MMMVLITKEKRHCMIEEDRNNEHACNGGRIHGIACAEIPFYHFFFFFFFFFSSFYANNRKIPKRKKKEFDCFYKGVQSLPDS